MNRKDMNHFGVGNKIAFSGIQTASGIYTHLTAGLDGHTSINVYNNSNVSVFVGPSGTVEADMTIVPTGTSLTIDVREVDEDNGSNALFVYGGGGAVVDVRVIEID